MNGETSADEPALLERHGTLQDPEDLSRIAEVTYSNVDESAYWRFAGDVLPSVASRIRFSNGDAIREAPSPVSVWRCLQPSIAHEAVRRGALSIVLANYIRSPIAMHALQPSMHNQTARARAFIDSWSARSEASQAGSRSGDSASSESGLLPFKWEYQLPR